MYVYTYIGILYDLVKHNVYTFIGILYGLVKHNVYKLVKYGV